MKIFAPAGFIPTFSIVGIDNVQFRLPPIYPITDKKLAEPMIEKMTAVDKALCSADLHIPLKVSVRRMTPPTRIEYKQAIAADSTGVMRPV